MTTVSSSRKLVVIVGAGSTLSDASSKSLKLKPPLDRGFFSACSKVGPYDELARVKNYLEEFYGIDPIDSSHDSLERMMAIIYADINSAVLGAKALEAFTSLIKLFNRRIAETTNVLSVSNRGNLYRILASKLAAGYLPNNICLVTFNQDIQIEKTLARLQSTAAHNRYGRIWSFPHCYRLSKAGVSQPPANQPKFQTDASDEGGMRILKLHGSLNWFSWHKTSNISRSSVLSRTKRFLVTPRSVIPASMNVQIKSKRMFAFPMVIPPVTHKASIIHDDLQPIWAEAEKSLLAADDIIVFGYSCPAADFESANLLRRTTRPTGNSRTFSVIDPSCNTFMRYVEITGFDQLGYFRKPSAFLVA